jgi:hypothetical protein
VLAFTSGTWGWSLALGRDLDPVWAWLPWLALALALVPAMGARLAPPAVRLGDVAGGSPGRATLGAAAAAVLLVLVFPDRVRFVGDALLRQRTLEVSGLVPTAWYPQALPLDLAIHHRLAETLMHALGVSAAWPGRAIGALDAALLAACAVAFPRVLGWRGAPALAAGAIVFWGGALTLFTGYNKAFAEMAVASAAAGVLALRAVRTGRGLGALGLVVAAALLAHRSALALLPVGVAAWVMAPKPTAQERRRAWLAGLAPVAALAAMLPRIVRIVTRIDPMHFAPQPLAGRGFLSALLGGARPVDLSNLLVMLVPVAPVALALVVAIGRPLGARREARVLLALAAPFLAIMPFIHPGQGLFRDWDDFAATGTALALVTAWLTGEALRASPRGATLAPAVVLACALPATQWLAHQGDLDRGLARVRRFVTEPPRRIPFERAVTWQFLGQAESARGRFANAADDYAAAVVLLPSPNLERQWGTSELRAARFDRARRVFRAMVARDSTDAFGWAGLALAAARIEDDSTEANVAAERAARLDPDLRVRRAMLGALGPEVSR